MVTEHTQVCHLHKQGVLILVVVEYGHGVLNIYFDYREVLILVVVEYGHGGHLHTGCQVTCRLNPCCGGIWSRSFQYLGFNTTVQS